MYVMNMRPEMCFAVNILIQFLTDPRYVHLIAAKHILRYLKGTVARISPCYRGKNGSLMPIGNKGRFLLMVNAEK